MTSPGRPIQLPPTRIPVEDPAAVRDRARRRIRFVGGLLGLLMAGVAARGVQLAVNPDARTLDIASSKRWASVTTQGERGMVVAADGTVLAKSVRHPAVFVDPEAVRLQASSRGGVPVETIAAQLAQLLERPTAEIHDVLLGQGRYVRLAKGVHPEVADTIRDLGLARRGVIIEQNFRRFYPQGTFASQLLGFVDDGGIGRQGVERQFHADLTGEEIVSQHRINRWGSVLELWSRDERSVEGHTVHLTIDRVVQRATERALAEVMERHAPISATAVVVEVATGKILAMATAPSFNPNDLGALEGGFGVTRNLSITDAVEPGSVFKPFTMAAGIEAGVVKANTVIESTSPYVLHGVRIRDDHPHDRVTVSEMVKYSSNIAAAKVAQKVGGDGLLDTFEAFGFGELLGIDTQGEVRGARRPRHHFGPVELATISYGQGVTATALQLAMATAALGNDGVRLRPLLVDKVTDSYGRVVRTWSPVVVRRAVSPETAQIVTRAMEMVLEDGGTGTKARIPGYRAAGKTGTAEKASQGGYSAARLATFVGFAPSETPEVAMAIIVDEPSVGSRYGGVVAGPAFSAVMAEALRQRGVLPDPALLAPVGSPEDDTLVEATERPPVRLVWQGDAWSMPDLSGRSLRDALAGLQGTGLRLQVEGSGVLAEQRPAPGRTVAPGEVVELRFQ